MGKRRSKFGVVVGSSHVGVEFKKYNHKVVLCKLTDSIFGDFEAKAKCSADDVFNEAEGMQLALTRACEKRQHRIDVIARDAAKLAMKIRACGGVGVDSRFRELQRVGAVVAADTEGRPGRWKE